jgi:S1-C subfamily serine protease
MTTTQATTGTGTPIEIDTRLVRVAKLLGFKDGKQIGNATGFFFLRDGYLYVVTNRHVVADDINKLYPTELHVRVHSDKSDLTAHDELVVPIVDGDGEPLWREHPELGDKVDVVAVPVNDPTVIANWHVDVFEPEDFLDETTSLPLGQSVIVIGFPLGFEDTLHRLPMIRNATIASVYPLPFKGERYFLTDARMHRGTSGSPVVARITETGAEGPRWKLLGVHSASLDVSNRDPEQDEKLGLNMAWYASLIEEMTRVG